jgi:hypothetical protein
VGEESTAELRRGKALYNPVVLNVAVNQAVERLLKTKGEKRQDVTPLCQRVRPLRPDFGWILVSRQRPLFDWKNY